MSPQQDTRRRINTEELDGGVIVARFVGDELGLFGREDAPELFDLVERADRDRDVRAVVFTGSHPRRFPPRKHWQSGRSMRSSLLIASFPGPSNEPNIWPRGRPRRSRPSSGR